MLKQDDASALIARRHPEWTEFQKRWRWLQDSLEGGDRYRHADYFRGPFEPPVSPWYAYGFDAVTGEGYPFAYNQIVERNLVPHRSEMSIDNRDMYALRMNRTPVPALVSRVVRKYLSRVYSKSIARTGPKPVEAWWGDVDGRGSTIAVWMRKTVGPLLVALGQIDLVFGRPAPPDGLVVETRAQQAALGLGAVAASYILPENLVWWSLDAKGRYRECLVREIDESGGVCWRHWNAEGCDVYTGEGEPVASKSYEYGYGRPPIIRVFDDRKLRCRNVGQSRMEVIAELQKNIYNRRSELILTDVQYLHPLIQGPEDYCQSDSKVPMGPGGALPKKKNTNGGASTYEGWEYLDNPTSGAVECRAHIGDDLDDVLADAALMKPAGSTGAGTVAQSGVSKGFDAREGNDVLSEIAATLRDAELSASRTALMVATGGEPSPADLGAVSVDYPREFELMTAEDLGSVLADLQVLAGASGLLPETEGEVLKRLISAILPGLDEDRLGELHDEVAATVATNAARIAAPTPDAGADTAAEFGAYSTEDPAISLPRDANAEANMANLLLAPDLS